MSRRPEVFISATSADLRSCRQVIKEALLTLGCMPVEQTNFPPDYRSVREMLRVKIAACDALVHLAGEVYGAEPKMRAPGEPRRSYTQMEYDLARELGKPVYTFVCGDNFPYDSHPPEDDEKRALQLAHRAALRQSETLRYSVASPIELGLKVRELQTRVEHLGAELKKSRRHLARGVALGLAALVVLGGGMWWLAARADKTDTKVARLETELDRQRRYIQSVADAYTQQQAELEKLKLSDEEKFNRAVASVAAREKIAEAALRSGINLFVAAVRSDPQASFMDRALADFAQKNFAGAAANAGQAALAAREQRLAAEKLARDLQQRAGDAATAERNAFNLQGQALHAQKKYAEAQAAFEAALAVTPRKTSALPWAELQRRLARTLDDWADVSEGRAIGERRDRAIAILQETLGALPPQESPAEWALMQNNLGNALREKAGEAIEWQPLLARSAAAYEAALTIRTREASPDDWARTQNNLGLIARDRALEAVEPQRSRHLADAVSRFRAAISAYSANSLVGSHNNLALALDDQADLATGAERGRLREEALAALQRDLASVVRERHPEEWAKAQSNLAGFLNTAARECGGDRKRQLLERAIAASRAALEIYTRAAYPQDWARAQTVLADALDQASDEQPLEERVRQRRDMAALYRAALQVQTREALPVSWAGLQLDLATVLRETAYDAPGAERAALLTEAQTAAEAASTILTRSSRPLEWARTQDIAADLLGTQARNATGPERRKLQDAATAARRRVLEVYTREGLPLKWAGAQVSLADALDDEANDAEDPRRSTLRAEAVAAARAALTVYTREGMPVDWAGAQRLLAYVLAAQREDSAGVDHPKLQAEAIAARRAVLEVFSRAEFPGDWAEAQLALAEALWVQARFYTIGPDRARIFDESVAACRAALEVHTFAASPRRWAFAQGQLAAAFSGLASETRGTEAVRYRREEVAANRAKFKFYTREDHPLQWAQSQESLAGALQFLAAALGAGAEADALRQEAERGLKAALEVFTRKDEPQGWAATHAALALLFSRRAHAAKDDAIAARFLTDAIAAERTALEVYTREAFPMEWAKETDTLADLMIERGKRLPAGEDVPEIVRGIALYQTTLEFWREGYPHQWANNHFQIGNACNSAASGSKGEARTRFQLQAVASFRTALPQAHTAGPAMVKGLHQHIADTLEEIASEAPAAERGRALAEAVMAYRAALDVIPRTDELGWGLYRARLAGAIIDQAFTLPEPERNPRWQEAIAFCRAGLEVRARSKINAALNELHLSRALLEDAARLKGAARAMQLREAAAAARAALVEITPAADAKLNELGQAVVQRCEQGLQALSD